MHTSTRQNAKKKSLISHIFNCDSFLIIFNSRFYIASEILSGSDLESYELRARRRAQLKCWGAKLLSISPLQNIIVVGATKYCSLTLKKRLEPSQDSTQKWILPKIPESSLSICFLIWYWFLNENNFYPTKTCLDLSLASSRAIRESRGNLISSIRAHLDHFSFATPWIYATINIYFM